MRWTTGIIEAEIRLTEVETDSCKSFFVGFNQASNWTLQAE
jgi:hypothetical protein